MAYWRDRDSAPTRLHVPAVDAAKYSRPYPSPYKARHFEDRCEDLLERPTTPVRHFLSRATARGPGLRAERESGDSTVAPVPTRQELRQSFPSRSKAFRAGNVRLSHANPHSAPLSRPQGLLRDWEIHSSRRASKRRRNLQNRTAPAFGGNIRDSRRPWDVCPEEASRVRVHPRPPQGTCVRGPQALVSTFLAAYIPRRHSTPARRHPRDDADQLCRPAQAGNSSEEIAPAIVAQAFGIFPSPLPLAELRPTLQQCEDRLELNDWLPASRTLPLSSFFHGPEAPPIAVRLPRGRQAAAQLLHTILAPRYSGRDRRT